MSERVLLKLGGLGALTLGVVLFIVFPILGLLEAIAGVFVLGAHPSTKRVATGTAIIPTMLIVGFAVFSTFTTDGPTPHFAVGIMILATLTALVLARAAAITATDGSSHPDAAIDSQRDADGGDHRVDVTLS